MAIYRRFRVQRKYVNGQPTEEYRLGAEIDSTDYNSLEECEKGSDCTQLEYRWVDMESADDYICDGTNKYKKQKKQQKCVNEETWTNVYPYEYQKGELIEQNSIDCGYDPSVGYHIYGRTDGHGSINISPSKEYYSSADIVTITALPSTNYIFSCYNYGGNITYGSVAYNSVLSLTMSHNWYVSAVFRSAAPSVGSLYYSYYNGTESWYEWSKSTLSKGDNSGTRASIIIDYSGVIQMIPSNAFSSQKYLSYINLPNCLSIGHQAFIDCYSLATVDLPLCEYVDGAAFMRCSRLSSVNLPLCEYVGHAAFYYCSTLTSIDLPNCSYVGDAAFSGCSTLQSVNLPNCSYVGSRAFSGCSVLPFIDLQNCSYVGDYAFGYCSSLTSINLPLCGYVGGNAFRGCSSITSIDLPNCSYVGDRAFGWCSALSSVNLPLCEYVNGAFYSCISLTSIDLPNCKSIDKEAFGNCSALQSVNLPLCEHLGFSTFINCYSLTSVNLPLCEYVGIGIFYNCSALQSIHLPKVTYFGSQVFYSAHIETLYMEQITSVPSGYDPSINSSYIKSIFIPSSLLNKFVSHSIWSKYSSYFVCI